MRLIDADELVAELIYLYEDRGWHEREIHFSLADMRCNVDIIPTVDAVSEKEVPMRVLWSGWKGIRDTRYRCQRCNKPVKNDDIYCHRCGQKLLFPEISFTPYIEGQKQEVIVRWSNEIN